MVCGGGEQVGERARGDPERDRGGDADEQGGRHGGGHAIVGAAAGGAPSRMRPELRTSAAKATAISSMAAPSTGSRASAATGRWPARWQPRERRQPEQRDQPDGERRSDRREHHTTPVMSAMVVEPCAACNWPPARNSTVLPMP